VSVPEEVFSTRTLSGELVEVRLTDGSDLAVTVGELAVTPRWGSQAFDDWLDWISGQRDGPPCPLPADDPDWLKDEGYGEHSAGW
jgi:hypothetical protein